MKKFFILLLFVLYIGSSIVIFSKEKDGNNLIKVEIRGEVINEAILEVPLGTTFNDVLNKINLTKDADISQISLNSVLSNNQIIIIPKTNENKLISINSAGIDELITLPNIGPKIAERIIEYRNKYGFKSLDELKNVKGIGEKTYEKLKQYICL